jgi:hypothetical protein
VLAATPMGEPAADSLFQGGHYCTSELSNDPNRIDP